MQNVLSEAKKVGANGVTNSEGEPEIAYADKSFGFISLQKFGIDFKYLFLEQVLQMRTTWFYTLCLSVVFPLLTLFGFTKVGGSVTTSQSLIYIIAGSSIYSMELVVGCIRMQDLKIGNRLSQIKLLPHLLA